MEPQADEKQDELGSDTVEVASTLEADDSQQQVLGASSMSNSSGEGPSELQMLYQINRLQCQMWGVLQAFRAEFAEFAAATAEREQRQRTRSRSPVRSSS